MAPCTRLRYFALSARASYYCPRLSRPYSSTPSMMTDKPSNPFLDTPSPPRLDKEEQEIFENLQRQSTGAFSTPRAPPKVNQSPDSDQQEVNADSGSEESHPDLKLGARPEFEGDQNPRTGEVGGPKNEPLRWGSGGDWSYNGRVTDF